MNWKRWISFFTLFFIFSVIGFSQAEVKGVKITINAPKLAVFDAASQVLIEKGFALITTNERVGLITTDYIKAEESFGTSLLLSLFGKKDIEIMVSTNITGVGNKSTLSIFPKARVKKGNRIKTEYEEMTLGDKSVEQFYKIGEQIKFMAEGGDSAAVPEETTEYRPTEPVNAPRQETPRNAPKEIEATKEASFVRVKVNVANIRNSPSMQGGIIMKATSGLEYRLIGIDGDWYEILLDDNKIGYINNNVCEQFTKIITVAVPVENDKEKNRSDRYEESESDEIDRSHVYRPGQETSGYSRATGFEEEKFIFGVGGGFSFIMSEISEIFPIGFGLDLNTHLMVMDRIYFTGYMSGYFYPGEEDFTMLRIQPMVGIQYRYPLNEKMILFGGIGLGLAIDIIGWSGWGRHLSDTEAAFATDFMFGVRMKSIYINPRFRLLGHEGDSYSSFDISVGFIF